MDLPTRQATGRARLDARLIELAERQRGIVSVRQLRELGLDKHGVRHRVRIGRLRRVHRGVCAVGHGALSTEARWMAALLACGGGPAVGGRDEHPDHDSPSIRGDEERAAPILELWGAALSHRSAAAHWGLLSPIEGPVDVSVPGNGGKATRRGIRLHRSATLLPVAVTLRDGIPVTTPARTIADLRRAAALRGKRRLVSPRELRRAARQADVLGLPIGAPPERDGLRSDLEGDFREACRRWRLPEPEANVRVGRYLVDFLWRERRLIVETDSYLYHRGEAAFEDDHSRDFELRRLGYRVERLSAGQLDAEPGRIGRWLAEELAPP